MSTRSTPILRQVYEVIATIALMLVVIWGGLYFLQIKRHVLETKISHYHISSIALASNSKVRLFQTREALAKLNSLAVEASDIDGLTYLIEKDLSKLKKIQRDFKAQEFVFTLDMINKRFDDFSALVLEDNLSKKPFLKLTSSLILEFARLERLHHMGANDSLKQIDRIEGEVYPVLFSILFLSLLTGGWRLNLSLYRIKKIISDRDKEHSARLKAQEELGKTEQRVGRILDNSFNEIYIFNSETLKFIQASLGACRNLNYSAEEMTHLTPLDLKPEYTQETFEKLTRPLREKQEPMVTFETAHKRKDGTLYPVSIRLQLMHNETPPVFVAIIEDITERKKAQQELQKYQEHLEELVEERTRELEKSQKQLIHSEKLSALGKLTGSISHEFNNPLQGLRNVIDILSQSTPSEKEVKLADLGKKECDRMAEMIASLRGFSKPSSGKVSSTDINQCMEEVLALQIKSLKERGIQVNRQFSDNLPKIEVVEDQIKQVLLNIIQNSAESISGAGQIILTTKKQDSHIIMKIQDTGHGISEENKKNLFEPFFTTKGGKGIGLGLSISYGIIQNHGGNIEVESDLDKGTIVTVILPVQGRISTVD